MNINEQSAPLISQMCHNMSSVELPITDSNGVTKPKFIILTTRLTTGLMDRQTSLSTR